MFTPDMHVTSPVCAKESMCIMPHEPFVFVLQIGGMDMSHTMKNECDAACSSVARAFARIVMGLVITGPRRSA